MTEIKTVWIPSRTSGRGYARAIEVELEWVCPRCGGPRGEVTDGFSFDGSHRMKVSTWKNACGHVDLYGNLHRELGLI